MKVRDKRKLITDEIKSGRITEYGFVSSRSKVIRNLNSEQCDRILASKQIKYSDHEDIVAKEGIIFSENVLQGTHLVVFRIIICFFVFFRYFKSYKN